MNSIIKFKLKDEQQFRYFEITNCPLFTEEEINGEKKQVICQLSTETLVHDAISQYLKNQGMKGYFHSIEVIECGRVIAKAENLSEHGNLKLSLT